MLRALSPYYLSSIVGSGLKVTPKNYAKAPFSTSQAIWNLLQVESVNQNTRRLEYAVRGPLVIRACQLDKEIKQGTRKSFNNVIFANIGDCHAMNQKPLTFFRNVLACAANTKLLDSKDTPEDVKERVRELLAFCGGQSVGAYSDSCGLEIIRRHIADYIVQRDNGAVESNWQDIFLSTGASEAVKVILSFTNHSRKPPKPVGVMIPIPQYPLYSASLCEFGIDQINYYLDENNEWQLDVEELKRAYKSAADHCDIRAIVVINPGNPTGSVLDEKNVLEVVEFAKEHKLIIIADEVYQHNVYDEDSEFVSFKKVLTKTGYKDLELVSLMSASKGFMGECGLRGGYCELTNFSDDVKAILFKGLSSRLCPSVLGQITMDLVVKPPAAGDDSFSVFEDEKNQVLSDLKRKAKLVTETFNSVEGVECNKVAGAMYAFPRLALPARAIEEARSKKQAPDFYYASEFLENFGVCIVPGSGFGQQPGTHHFRTTILPQPEVFEDMMYRFKTFHGQFSSKYS